MQLRTIWEVAPTPPIGKREAPNRGQVVSPSIIFLPKGGRATRIPGENTPANSVTGTNAISVSIVATPANGLVGFIFTGFRRDGLQREEFLGGAEADRHTIGDEITDEIAEGSSENTASAAEEAASVTSALLALRMGKAGSNSNTSP